MKSIIKNKLFKDVIEQYISTYDVYQASITCTHARDALEDRRKKTQEKKEAVELYVGTKIGLVKEILCQGYSNYIYPISITAYQGIVHDRDLQEIYLDADENIARVISLIIIDFTHIHRNKFNDPDEHPELHVQLIKHHRKKD
jgi:hypothetical protein